MKHYLIFDSHCPICCNLAQAIEEGASGKLKAISIYGPEARELLQTAYPEGWDHQPYLLTVENSSVKAAAGIAMALRLALLLGPRNAWRIWQLSQQYGVSLTRRGIEFSPERRGFLRQVAWFFAALLVFPRDLLDSIARRSAQAGKAPSPAAGELYNGFVLLSEGAPVPSMVKPSRFGKPILCGAGEGGPTLNAVTQTLNRLEDLSREGRLPLYTLGHVPVNLRDAGGHIIRHPSGEVFVVSVDLESPDAEGGAWERSVRLRARPDFPRPFPLWSSNPVELGGPAVVLEKVDFLPTPGIRVEAQGGYVFYWIDRDILYTLAAEYGPSREEAQSLASSLQPVG